MACPKLHLLKSFNVFPTLYVFLYTHLLALHFLLSIVQFFILIFMCIFHLCRHFNTSLLTFLAGLQIHLISNECTQVGRDYQTLLQ